jgi:hypothetical protein
MMLADPAFLIAELIEPAHHLQVPFVAFPQPALRRMRRHREISEFHGVSSAVLVVVLRCKCLCPRAKSSTTRAFNHWLCGGEMMADAIEAK